MIPHHFPVRHCERSAAFGEPRLRREAIFEIASSSCTGLLVRQRTDPSDFWWTMTGSSSSNKSGGG
ncbi:MAG: hypothetical protein HYS55_00255 [Candidatus Omnitrophica bacterium]|nr:hypothetical protein [Candidatus Omnitrophota bacterium]